MRWFVVFKEDRSVRDNVLSALIFLVGGFVLVTMPELSTDIICAVLGLTAILFGLLRILFYFRRSIEIGIAGQGLARGLILIAAGLLVLLKPQVPASVLPVILGFCLIAGGLFKLQLASDLMRMQYPRWFLSLIASGLLLILGVLVVANPFSTAVVLMRFIGFAMILEAVSDILSIILLSRARKRFKAIASGQAPEE